MTVLNHYLYFEQVSRICSRLYNQCNCKIHHIQGTAYLDSLVYKIIHFIWGSMWILKLCLFTHRQSGSRLPLTFIYFAVVSQMSLIYWLVISFFVNSWPSFIIFCFAYFSISLSLSHLGKFIQQIKLPDKQKSVNKYLVNHNNNLVFFSFCHNSSFLPWSFFFFNHFFLLSLVW